MPGKYHIYKTPQVNYIPLKLTAQTIYPSIQSVLTLFQSFEYLNNFLVAQSKITPRSKG